MITLHDIFELVTDERGAQDNKWGTIPERVTDDFRWLGVLAEELGEVAMALNDHDPVEHQVEELVQVAAVAVAWIQWLSHIESDT